MRYYGYYIGYPVTINPFLYPIYFNDLVKEAQLRLIANHLIKEAGRWAALLGFLSKTMPRIGRAAFRPVTAWRVWRLHREWQPVFRTSQRLWERGSTMIGGYSRVAKMLRGGAAEQLIRELRRLKIPASEIEEVFVRATYSPEYAGAFERWTQERLPGIISGRYTQEEIRRMLAALPEELERLVPSIAEEMKSAPRPFFERLQEAALERPEQFGRGLMYAGIGLGAPFLAFRGLGIRQNVQYNIPPEIIARLTAPQPIRYVGGWPVF